MTSEVKASGAGELLSEDHCDLDLLLSAVFDALDVRNPTEVFARLDLFWARLAMHIRAENCELFPAISDVTDTSLREHALTADEKADIDDALAQLRGDHDFFMSELADGIKRMREAGAVPSANAQTEMIQLENMLTELRSRIASHNKLEEAVVYRLPAKILDPIKLRMLQNGVRRELENLPPRIKERTRD